MEDKVEVARECGSTNLAKKNIQAAGMER